MPIETPTNPALVATGFHAPQRPRAIRALNASWRSLARVGIARVSLDERSLVAAARRSSGLHHFADESFREPMRRMLASIEDEARLHPLGRMTMRQTLIRWLATRLDIGVNEVVNQEPLLGKVRIAIHELRGIRRSEFDGR